jgi:hypothetical protein
VIATLTNDEGICLSGHEEKAACLWRDFKERLEISDNPNMLFNLVDLVQPVEGLYTPALAYSTDEIDSIMQNMSSNKALGPDGFNGRFLKTCWHIIKN